MDHPDVTVVICTRNRAANLRAVLADLRRQRGLDDRRWEVLVVDNGSSDETPAVVRVAGCEKGPPVRYFYEPRIGKPFALNTAIANTFAPILVFTDDDVGIPETWLAALLRPFDDPTCMGVGGAVRPRWEARPPDWLGDGTRYRIMGAVARYDPGATSERPVAPPIGGNCAYRREVFSRHGGYREALCAGPCPIGFEDIELGARLIRAGERVVSTKDAVVDHPVRPDRLKKDYFLSWYYRRGRAEPYLHDIPADSVFWMGVPRYLFREAALSLGKWAVAAGRPRRFYYKLRFYGLLGMAAEFIRARPGAGGLPGPAWQPPGPAIEPAADVGDGPPDVSVVICTRNRSQSLKSVLRDLGRQEGVGTTRWEVLVVDSASSDDTEAVVKATCAGGGGRVRYRRESRPGKTVALNAAITATEAPILVLTDDDVEIPTGWLAAMLRPFASQNCLGVGGRVVPRWGTIPPRWVSPDPPYRMMGAIVRYDQGSVPGPVTVPPIGANCAYRRRAFERHGGYREDLGPGAGGPWGDDTEFGARLITAGEMIWYAPEAVVVHPVLPERLTRQYFLDWYFASGRAAPYVNLVPSGPVILAGAPRYLWRQLVTSLVKWLSALAPRRRFYFKLDTWRTLGAITEYRRLRARRVAGRGS